MPSKKLSAFCVLFLIVMLGLLLLLNILALSAHGATTSRRPNAFGALISDDNPNMYILGAFVSGSVHFCDKDEPCTTITVHEFGTPLLTPSPTLTFCGEDQLDMINDAVASDHWLVWVYRRQARRIYDGIACHDLIKVIPVKGVK